MIFRSTEPNISIPEQPLTEIVLQRAIEFARNQILYILSYLSSSKILQSINKLENRKLAVKQRRRRWQKVPLSVLR
jgi:hypothetical protein